MCVSMRHLPAKEDLKLIEKNKRNRIEILKAIKQSENILLSLQKIDCNYEIRQARI